MTDEIRIVPFKPHHAKAFRDLNIAWIETFFAVEKLDLKALNNPVGYYLEAGGAIFMAENSMGDVLGTVAMLPLGEGCYELSKMAVSDGAKGKGVGFALGSATIQWARHRNASEIYLETNAKLLAAVSLYHKLGFTPVDRGASPYARADVQMALKL